MTVLLREIPYGEARDPVKIAALSSGIGFPSPDSNAAIQRLHRGARHSIPSLIRGRDGYNPTLTAWRDSTNDPGRAPGHRLV